MIVSSPMTQNRFATLAHWPFIGCLVALWFVLNTALAQDFPTVPEDDDDIITTEPPVPDEPLPPPKPAPPGPLRMAQKVVMLGRVPYMNIKDMMKHAKSLLGFLRKELGVKDVRLVTAKDYAGVLEALSRGTIDFAWVGPTAYVIAKEKMPLMPLAKTKPRPGSSYRGMFITRKDSNILGIEDIKGKIIGFVDHESASGYLYPLAVLNRSKINPQKDCKQVVFLKKHDAVLAAVLAKKIDVGACLEETLASLKEKSVADQIMVLGKTEEIPADVVVCREDCPAALQEKMLAALLKITGNLNGPGQPLQTEFLATSDEEFNSVRDILKGIKSIMK